MRVQQAQEAAARKAKEREAAAVVEHRLIAKMKSEIEDVRFLP